jgi:hypothetical protein
MVTMDDSPTRQEVWDRWIDRYALADSPVPLFETDDDLRVATKTYGRDDRPILKRSPRMEVQLESAVKDVVGDWKSFDDTYDGVIYLTYTLDGDEVVPRYIGKAGKYGRDGESLSVNLKNIETNRTKFARWGDGYAYHIGNLSAVVLDHHERDSVSRDDPRTSKYQEWASALFEPDSRRLQEPVYYWVRAWREDDVGPFYEFETNLEVLEYYLIGLASQVYPEQLLNVEGTS